jgi:hypothetical protein
MRSCSPPVAGRRSKDARRSIGCLLACALVLFGAAGCGSVPEESSSDGTGIESAATSAVADEGGATSSTLSDDAGRVPRDAFLEHMRAIGTGDPMLVWSTYAANPPAEYVVWAQEWEDAAEIFASYNVLEQRVIGPDVAQVRVVYRMRAGDDEVIVEEPGEWWRIEKVDGLWKVGWLPRQ